MQANKIIKGVKAVLKKGAPTDTLFAKNVSAINGHKVPMKTMKAETDKSKLFITNPLSRLIIENWFIEVIVENLTA